MRLLLSILICCFIVTAIAEEHPEVVLTTGHNDQINAMVITQNGQFLASASNDKIIKIWEVDTGMEFRTISGTDGRVEQLAFSPDNVHLAGTTFNNELLVWNVITGEVVYESKSSNSKGLAFVDDGKKLIFINEDGHIAIWNFETGVEQEVLDKYTITFIADEKKNLAYGFDHEGNLFKVDVLERTLLATYPLFDHVIFPFTNGDITEDGRYIAYGYADDRLRIFDTELGKFSYESKPYSSKIATLAFDRSKPVVYLAIHGENVELFDFEKEKTIERTHFGGGGLPTQCIGAHPDGEIVLFANFDKITLYDFNRRKVFKQLDKRVNRIFNISYDPTGRYLAIATDKIKLQIWDLKLNKVVNSIPAFFPCHFTANGKSVIGMSHKMTLGQFNIETGELEKEFITDYELIQSLAVSDDGTKLAGAGYQNSVKIWDLTSTDRIATLTGHTAGILALDFHPEEPWIVSGSLDETCRVWNYETGKELKQFTDQTVSIKGVKFSPDGGQLATASWDQTILLRKVENWEVEFILKDHVNVINSIDYSADGKVLISGAGNNSVHKADNSVICWNAKTGEQLCRFTDHRNEVLKVESDPLGTRFFSASVDGSVKLFDYKTCDLIATYHAIGEREFMIYTPDNYYIASRDALKGIAFRLKDKMVPFEQFDIHLNRPDIVAKRIGKSSKQLIQAYHYLYLKRLKKLNLKEENLRMDFQLPNVLNETKYAIVTSEKSQKLWIKAWDESYPLKQINVFVNDVPIFGEGGFKITDQVKSYRKEIEVPLINGKNKILISCMNSNGVESLYESIEIIRDSEPEKHNLYIVAIGVSNYKDDRFSLKYPVKDAKDIRDKFLESSAMYANVYSKLVLDEEVTIENIVALDSFFENCTHEDMAIIFIAGHGVLNSEYDYYYGTYDMDFDNPEGRGLAYDRISKLLNQIKAYQKLLIMDTCHSGELDKDEVEKGLDVEIEDGDVEFRGAGAGVRIKEGIGFENSLKITEDLFSDIRKGSGATVVSSAGGAEFAMEGDRWNNGLFTYAFLKGLTNNAANANQDEYIQLSEIRRYVNSLVTDLSNGQQIPSAREENISRDYIIFGN